MKKTTNGFTFIELLVVVAIIAILSAIIIANVSNVRTKARDAQRIVNLEQVALALETYKSNYGTYPNPGGSWRSTCKKWQGLDPEDVIPGLVPNILPRLPKDPLEDPDILTSKYCYLYWSNGTDYAFLYHQGAETDYNAYPDYVDPRRDGGTDPCVVDGTSPWALKVSSGPGGVCR